MFNKILVIGAGLIGSSLAKAIKEKKISSKIYGIDLNNNVIEKCKKLKIFDTQIRLTLFPRLKHYFKNNISFSS